MKINQIIHGDALKELKELPSNSVDAVVTDPPYGICFMGEEWDSFSSREYQEFSYNWGKEALRVLKPGGYLLVFSGCRTYHRMVTGLEDAGFHIHDMISWVYGSGFPKGLDLSKAIDYQAFLNWCKEKGIKLDEPKKVWNGEHQDKLQEIIEEFGYPNGVREITKPKPWKSETTIQSGGLHTDIGRERIHEQLYDTAPATPEAQQWEGWKAGKQTLKPAHEPICVAQKPVEGNYVQNVLKWWCGGLNIDDCRIGYKEDMNPNDFDDRKRTAPKFSGLYNAGKVGEYRTRKGEVPDGRFPPNLIIDEFVAELLDEQSGDRVSGGDIKSPPSTPATNVYGNYSRTSWDGYKDSGGCSRFFKIVKPFMYCPKAGSKERDAGLDDVEHTPNTEMVKRKEGSAGINNPMAGAGRTGGAKNTIPSLKPINLMRWLVRLVTPEGGVVLDPFAGSGTTAVACVTEGFNYVLIEKQEKFAKMVAPKRIKFWSDERNWDNLKKHNELPKPNKNHPTLSDY